MNKWTLNIGRFGKIENAKIEVSPFMIFVGDNNSGKSYVMELLWGIISRTGDIINSLDELPSYQVLIDSSPDDSKNTRFVIPTDIQAKLVNCFNEAFEQNNNEFIKSIFNYTIPVQNVSISREDYFDLSFEIVKKPIIVFNDEDIEKESIEEHTRVHIYHEDNKILNILFRNNPTDRVILNSIYKRVLTFLIRYNFYESYSISHALQRIKSSREPLYFPASRTGFMHTYRAILGNQRENKELLDVIEIQQDLVEDNQIAGTNLTLPTILFLEKLQKITIDEEANLYFKSEIDFLTKYILQGTIQKNEFDHYEFTPANSNEGIPLHVTSSLVSELAPILIFLKSRINPKLWIIEEIESHLHPKIQLEVARFLVRLFNKGKCIWITTHSDSVVQKINNLITLSLKQEKEELLERLGFDYSDLFSNIDDIAFYQFDSSGNKTTINQLQLEEFGFEVPTFNDTLDQLIIETAKIQEVDERHHD